jgi:PEP-CTERM motif
MATKVALLREVGTGNVRRLSSAPLPVEETAVRLSIAAVVLSAVASPAAAGPLDTLQYRATLRTDLPVTAGPVLYPGDTAYLLGDSPAFGVVAWSAPDWHQGYPAYPSAGFAVVGLGGLAAFTAASELWNLELEGGGRHALDVEFRDAAGQVGALSFSGRFVTGWWHGSGDAWPLFDVSDSGGDLGAPPFPRPPTGSVSLGRTRYDVELSYGWPPDYRQGEDGQWFEVLYPADPVPLWDGAFWMEGNGGFLATVTATAAPEPSTLVLVGMSACAVWAARRYRQHGGHRTGTGFRLRDAARGFNSPPAPIRTSG